MNCWEKPHTYIMARHRRPRARRNHSRAAHNNRARRISPDRPNERASLTDDNNLKVVEYKPNEVGSDSQSQESTGVQKSSSSSDNGPISIQPSRPESNIDDRSQSIDSQGSNNSANSNNSENGQHLPNVTSYNISLNDCDVYNSNNHNQPQACSLAKACACNGNQSRQAQIQPQAAAPAVIVVEPKHDESLQCDCTSCQFFSGWCCMPCFLFVIIAIVIIWWCIANRETFMAIGSSTSEPTTRYDNVDSMETLRSVEWATKSSEHLIDDDFWSKQSKHKLWLQLLWTINSSSRSHQQAMRERSGFEGWYEHNNNNNNFINIITIMIINYFHQYYFYLIPSTETCNMKFSHVNTSHLSKLKLRVSDDFGRVNGSNRFQVELSWIERFCCC